ncbi:MAG: PAS domain-containing protein, partial [Pseudomonadota bacterium]
MAIEAEKLNQPSRARRVLDTLRDPVIMIDSANFITFANLQAEYFFSSSISQISKQLLDDYIAFSSPLLALIEQVREENAPINEYRVDLSSPRLGSNRLVDIHVTPVNE